MNENQQCAQEEWLWYAGGGDFLINFGINGMEAHICLGELMLFKLCFPYLPNLNMNRYLVPFSISIS